GYVRAKRAYDGVERDSSIERSVLYALRVAAVAIAERLEKRDDELVRLAIQTWMTTTKQLKDVVPSIEALGRLATEPAWQTSAGDLVSLTQLASYAQKTKAICVAPANSGRAVD